MTTFWDRVKAVNIPGTSKPGTAPLGLVTPNPPAHPNAGAALDTSKPAEPYHPPAPLDPLYEFEGKFYPKAEATALADAAQAAKAKAHLAALEAQQVAAKPVVTQSPVIAEAIAPEPVISSSTIVYTTESNVSKEAPVIHPAAVAAQPVKENTVATNKVVSFFENIWKDVEKTVPLLDKIQDAPAVQVLETTTIGSALTTSFTKYLDEASAVEASFAAAGVASTGATGLQKAAIVVNGVTPTLQQLAVELGAAPLTVQEIKEANDAFIVFAKLFKVPAATA